MPTLCERGIGTDCAIGDPNNVGGGLTTGQSKLGNFAELCTLAEGSFFDNNGECTDVDGNHPGQLWDPYSGAIPPDGITAERLRFIPFNNLADYISQGNAKLDGTPFQPAPGVPGNLLDPVAVKLFQLFPWRPGAG